LVSKRSAWSLSR